MPEFTIRIDTVKFDSNCTEKLYFVYTDANHRFGYELRQQLNKWETTNTTIVSNGLDIAKNWRKQRSKYYNDSSASLKMVTWVDSIVAGHTKECEIPQRIIYAGHSFGGLFGLRHFVYSKQKFTKYYLFNTSLWTKQSESLISATCSKKLQLYYGNAEKLNRVNKAHKECLAIRSCHIANMIEVSGNHISSLNNSIPLALQDQFFTNR